MDKEVYSPLRLCQLVWQKTNYKTLSTLRPKLKHAFFGFVSRADNIRAWVRVSTADLAISSGQGMSAW